MRVAVLGAAGRMGNEVSNAILAESDLKLVAAVDPAKGAKLTGEERELVISKDLDILERRDVEVAVDFTHPSAVGGNAIWCLEHGIHVVVGTTGMSAAETDRVRELAESGAANALVAPNFAIGAVLMMHLVQQVARHLPHAEIIELHHDGKADAPSGTALRTAELIAAARGEVEAPILGEVIPGARGADKDGIRVHGIRLPGLVAHQEVIFGGQGQTLTLRHDTIDRSSFIPGVLLAIRRISDLPGLTVGLESVLGL